MTQAYSADLRMRCVEAMRSGKTARSVAAQFSVSPSSVIKWNQRYAHTGSVVPDKQGGHRKAS